MDVHVNNIHKLRTTIFTILVICIASSLAAPPIENREQIGPCIGMDCLHGVLMHGDDKQDTDHGKEDQYEKLQRQDVINANKKVPGPCQGEDCMEQIQHGQDDPDHAHKMEQKPGPEIQADVGPCQGMDCLHGVLMHGDEAQGKDHDGKHAKDIAKEAAKHAGKPKDVNPDTALHSGDEQNAHDPAHRVEQEKIEEENKQAPTVDLDALLHGGEQIDHSKMTENNLENKEHQEPTVGDLESLLHGSDDGKIIHSKERTKKEEKLLHEGKESGTLDPHALLHGEQKIGVGNVERDIMDDFNDWKKEKENDEEDAGKGYTFPFISDSLYNEIELLKRRYLPQFWAAEEESQKNTATHEHLPRDMGDDMRHELEDVGSTKPLSETSKHHSQPKRITSHSHKGKPKTEI